MKMLINKNILKIFGILIVSFICLIGIRYTVQYANKNIQSPYHEKVQSLLDEKTKVGVEVNRAYQEVMVENAELFLNMARETNRQSMNMIYVAFVVAIFVLYITAVVINLVTNKK